MVSDVHELNQGKLGMSKIEDYCIFIHCHKSHMILNTPHITHLTKCDSSLRYNRVYVNKTLTYIRINITLLCRSHKEGGQFGNQSLSAGPRCIRYVSNFESLSL